LLNRHPWIFSGAVADVQPADTGLGETVNIFDAGGKFIASAAYSPHSSIRARAWSWDSDIEIDRTFFESQLTRAISLRQESKITGETNAYRLVHAESDGLPGLIVDRYGELLVVQHLSAGVERWREDIVDVLVELTGCAAVFERSDAEVRALEGLDHRVGPMRGADPPDQIQIIEHGITYWVDVERGHKTGFYLDQRANRLLLRHLVQECEILDCFCYTGGFSLNALAGGAAQVTAVDASAEALALARQNQELNGFPQSRLEFVEADVFSLLRRYRDQGRNFDLIILDPPKFAPTAAHVERAARGYKDINLLAFKLLRPGGTLVTFSCSGGVSQELFQKILAGAALDAGMQAEIVQYLHQAADHPVALNFPEGAYLKGFVMKVYKM
jgi:23S rRNA (cytosine1962-C5)-methyltransferase